MRWASCSRLVRRSSPELPDPRRPSAESFFASLKGELIDLQAWPTRAMARRAVVEYIGWYNGTRLHSTVGYRSPAEFEQQDKISKIA